MKNIAFLLCSKLLIIDMPGFCMSTDCVMSSCPPSRIWSGKNILVVFKISIKNKLLPINTRGHPAETVALVGGFMGLIERNPVFDPITKQLIAESSIIAKIRNHLITQPTLIVILEGLWQIPVLCVGIARKLTKIFDF